MIIKNIYTIGLILITVLTVCFFACNTVEKNTYSQYFINTAQQKIIIDTLINSLNNNYIYASKTIEIEKDLTAFSQNLQSCNPREFKAKVNSILYENTSDKHLRIHYDTTFARSLIYQNMLVHKWNDRKYFEAYVEKDKELVSKNFEFEKVEVLKGNVGYLKFNYFPTIGDGQETFEASLKFLKNTDALIIDLQDNRGGSLLMVELILSYFFEAKTTLFYRHNVERADTTRYYADKIEYLNKFKKIPLYVLVSDKTASAAEIFSNTMKEKVRGRIIGTKTWGGAHVCYYQVLNEAFTVLIPKTEILGANSKKNWEAKGIKPHNIYEAEDIIDNAHLIALERLLIKEKRESYKRKILNLIASKKQGVLHKNKTVKKYAGQFAQNLFYEKNNNLYWKSGASSAIKCINIGNDQFIATNNSFTKIKFLKSGFFGFNSIYIQNKRGEKEKYDKN